MTIYADIAIIGAGPGGYTAALRASQLGARVVVAEKATPGGVCLNWGCIPTKALLRTAEVLTLVREAKGLGVIVPGTPTVDWAAAQKRKDRIVRRLTGGVKYLLDNAGVQTLRGAARFTSPSLLEVATESGVQTVEATSVIVASGSRAASLPIPGLQGEGIMTSDDALALQELPESLLIIGAGAIGVEFATLFAQCGVQVTLVEVLPRVLPLLDSELGAEVEKSLRKMRVRVHTNSRVTGVERQEDGLHVAIHSAEDTTVVAQKVLVAVGRRPNIEDMGLDVAGVYTERQGIVVDEYMRTNVPHIYAIGDVTGGTLLAHVAAHGGVIAAENALGGKRAIHYNAVPSCVFGQPEVATVGVSEDQAREQGVDIRVGKFPFHPNGKAATLGESDGFAKVILAADTGRILGLHIVGPHASDLIQEGTVAMHFGGTASDIGGIIHPHPTLTEAIEEAALAAEGRALNL